VKVLKKKIKLLLSKWLYPKTLARVRYRIFLWGLYEGTVKTPIIYGAYSARVNLTSLEMFIRNFDQIYSIQTVFKSVPSGRFVSDESFSKIELTPEDKRKGFQNPFAEDEIRELETEGRVLSYEERRHRKLLALIDQCEVEKFGY
jgi:hypothetical protein